MVIETVRKGKMNETLQLHSIDSHLNEFIPTRKPIKRKYSKGNK